MAINPMKVLTRLIIDQGAEITGSLGITGSLDVRGTSTFTEISSSVITGSIFTGSLGLFTNLTASKIHAVSGTIDNLTIDTVHVSGTLYTKNLVVTEQAYLSADVIDSNAGYFTTLSGAVATLTDLDVKTDANISGNFQVLNTASFGDLYVHKSSSYNNISGAYHNVEGLNVAESLRLLDLAIISAAEIKSAHESIRIQKTGSFVGEIATIILTDENALFDAESLTYVTIDILVKDVNDTYNPDWRNDLIYFSIKVNQDNKLEIIIDSGGGATHYRLLAINQKPNKFNVR